MRIALLVLCAAVLAAGESAAITAFKKSMADSDVYAKRDAIKALASSEAGTDRDVYPLLMQAISDRQTHDFAVEAMRQRSGLKPPARGKGTNYPGYPTSDDAADWATWMAAWTKDDARKKEIDDALKKKEPGKTPVIGQPSGVPIADPAATEAVAEAPRIPIDDLGKIDRLVYKSGRTLTAYLRSRRLDGEGNLISVRVVHRDGAGEEVIDASLISRIEEDIE
ncbi:MAG: hypothetical protein AAB263_05200 [Planctomycetota bacterium]